MGGNNRTKKSTGNGNRAYRQNGGDPEAQKTAVAQRNELRSAYRLKREALVVIKGNYQERDPGARAETMSFLQGFIKRMPEAKSFSSTDINELKKEIETLKALPKAIEGCLIYTAHKIKDEYKNGWNGVWIIGNLTSFFAGASNSTLYQTIKAHLEVSHLDDLEPEMEKSALEAFYKKLVEEPSLPSFADSLQAHIEEAAARSERVKANVA